MTISRRSLLQAAAMLPPLMLGAWPAGAARSGFTHGVASGDPDQQSVVLWSRFVPIHGAAAELKVQVAEEPRFRRIVARGTATAGPATDYCARAIPTGLKPGRSYYYRFIAADGATSPIGRTKTLPAGPSRNFRIGIVSCANATSGWFNAYAHAAARNDLDLIVHTGDYIYESPIDRSDAIAEIAAERDVQPHGEAVLLADYRLRYASYRRDPHLMELHRRFPMVVIWDDHEVANNSWKDGASNHGPDEGSWEARAAAGMRAFREWLPMRDAPYAQYQIGNLATLFRLETRLLARTRQLELDKGFARRPDVEKAVAAFRDGPLADPDRTMMGATQEKWLADGLAASTAAGTRWQLLAQQVIVSSSRLPPVSAGWFPPDAKLSPRAEADLQDAVALSKLGLPLGLDRWDGYPAARRRLLDSAHQARADLIVLSGDSHNCWAYNLEQGGKAVGVEFGGQSVSSLGLERRFGGNPALIAADFAATNPNLAWCDTSRRGYMVLDLTPERAINEWLFVPSLNLRSVELQGSHKMVAERGARRLGNA
jgi:alkaline phosphatase D